MRTYLIAFAAVCTLLVCGCSTSSPADAGFSDEQRDVLSLEYAAFDQTMGEGWRVWADRGEYAEAARMLDHYASTHDELTDSEWRIICFHAGQMYGYLGEYETAAERFTASLNPQEPPDSPFKWNAYVNGTIAFLERDLDRLRAMRNELAAQPARQITLPDGTVMERVPNLDVLERFIEHFDRTYREAYSGNVRGE